MAMRSASTKEMQLGGKRKRRDHDDDDDSDNEEEDAGSSDEEGGRWLGLAALLELLLLQRYFVTCFH